MTVLRLRLVAVAVTCVLVAGMVAAVFVGSGSAAVPKPTQAAAGGCLFDAAIGTLLICVPNV
jgi:hypothetical protein